jgi:hypothetical protein
MLCIGMRRLCKTRERVSGNGVGKTPAYVRPVRGRFSERGLKGRKADIRSSISSKERRLARTTLTAAAPTRNTKPSPPVRTSPSAARARPRFRSRTSGGVLRLTGWPLSP